MKNIEKNIDSSDKKIENKTNKDLSKVFEVTEVDPNSEEWKKSSYELLQNLYKQIIDLDDKTTFVKTTSLFKQYIEILKNSNEDIQDLFSSRLIRVCNKKKGLAVFAKQIEQDWWVFEFWKRVSVK